MALKPTGGRPPQQARPKYVYKHPSPEAIRERAERTSNRYDQIYDTSKIEVFTAREKSNLIRILPPTWDNYSHHAYTVYSHRDVGPEGGTYLCLWKMKGEPCPICAAARQAKDEGDEERRKALQFQERLLSWIVDRDADDWKVPRLFNMSWTQDRDLTAVTINKRTGKPLYIVDPEQGYDIIFERSGTGLMTRYFGYQADRDPSPICADPDVQEEILDWIVDRPIPSILIYQTAEYLQKALAGVAGGEPPALPAARPSALRRAAQAPSYEEDQGVSYDDAPDDEDAAAVAGNGAGDDESPWELDPYDPDAGEPAEIEEADFTEEAPPPPPRSARPSAAAPGPSRAPAAPSRAPAGPPPRRPQPQFLRDVDPAMRSQSRPAPAAPAPRPGASGRPVMPPRPPRR